MHETFQKGKNVLRPTPSFSLASKYNPRKTAPGHLTNLSYSSYGLTGLQRAAKNCKNLPSSPQILLLRVAQSGARDQEALDAFIAGHRRPHLATSVSTAPATICPFAAAKPGSWPKHRTTEKRTSHCTSMCWRNQENVSERKRQQANMSW